MKRIPTTDDRIVHINYETQYDLCSAFLRIQEFYESPYPSIQGKHFTMDQYMDIYAKETGAFTYFSDWSGFNVPGNYILEFWEEFYSDMRPKESAIVKMLTPYMRTANFYVIATYGKEVSQDTVKHELAHAYYYLDEKYKTSCEPLLANLNPKLKAKMTTRLLEMGYTEAVVPDEIQAYLSTSDDGYLKKHFKMSKTEMKHKLPFMENFQTYSKIESVV